MKRFRHRSVLVLDGTSRVIVTIGRSLRRRRIPTVCAQLGRRGLGLGSNAIEADVALTADPSAFIGELKDLLARYDADTVLPCSDRALQMLLPHFNELAGLAYIPLPEPHIVSQVLQKGETLAAAVRCGVRIPATHVVKDAADFYYALRTLRLPMVAKPLDVSRPNSFKVEHFETLDQLEAFQATCDLQTPLILQEFVAGDGVGVSTIVNGGKPLVLFQHRRIHEYPASGGVGVLFESEAVDPELARATATILESLGWSGPAMVEFRQDKRNGDYALMEVNGRFWGSLPLAVRAGVDFPLMQWEICHGMTPKLPNSYTVGLRMRWTAGELHRFADLMRNPSRRKRLGYDLITPVFQLIGSFDPRTRSALFSIADPTPEIRDCGHALFHPLVGAAWSLTKKVLPRTFASRISQLRGLDRRYRRKYLTVWLRGYLKPRRASNRDKLKGVQHVTMVCRANRIRSPLAAAILESRLDGSGNHSFVIRSAGTQTVGGSSFDPRASAAAAGLGLTLAGSPQKLTADLIESSHLLVVMDRVIEAELLTQFPNAAPKVLLLCDVAGNGSSDQNEILDPDKAPAPEFSRSVSRLAVIVEQMARVLGSHA